MLYIFTIEENAKFGKGERGKIPSRLWFFMVYFKSYKN